MLRRIILLAALVAFGPVAADAQFAPEAGDRLRITQTDGTVRTGRLRTFSSTEIQLFDDGADEALLISGEDVAGIERSLGSQRSFGKTFLVTVGIGTAAGMVGFGATRPVEEGLLCSIDSSTYCSRGEALWKGALVGAAYSVPIAVVLGVLVKRERWEAVGRSGESAASFSLVPGRDGSIGARVSLPVGGGE